ncbi:uncharacterized protein LOC134566025 [Pelobates fuscus]|uniref:uncharacterized protein LOC134566025 n=1 Tax=Pelobates fuscus TaxID=191477 RepID=UPI002FE4EC3A
MALGAANYFPAVSGNPCLRPDPRDYINLFVFLFAIEHVNMDLNILPNITLGYHFYDSCFNAKKAVKSVLQILCSAEKTIPNYSCTDHNKLAGFIGDHHSFTTIPIAEILGVYGYSQISYGATDFSLSDRLMYPHLFRMVQNDYTYFKIVTQLLKHFGWTWVGILTSYDETVGTESQILRKYMTSYDFHINSSIRKLPTCLLDTQHFISQIENIELTNTDTILATMDVKSLYTIIPKKEGMEAISEILQQDEAYQGPPIPYLMEWLDIALTCNYFKFEEHFYLQTSGTAMGAAMAPAYANGFMYWFENTYILPIYQHQIIKYLRYVDDIFMIWKGTTTTLEEMVENINSLPIPVTLTLSWHNTNIEFLDVSIFKEEDRLGFTLYRKVTDRNTLLSATSFHPQHIKDSLPISQFLRVLRFNSDPSKCEEQLHEVRDRFLARGFHPRILDIALDKARMTPPFMGKWEDLIGEKLLSHTRLLSVQKGTGDITQTVNVLIPKSICSEKCLPGTRKVLRQEIQTCCYDCILCSDGEITNRTDSENCEKCLNAEWPNERKDRCIPKLEEFLAYRNDTIAIILSSLSILCFLITFMILVIFIWYQDTPIVKANNKKLSFVLLVSIMLSFLCVFLFLGRPVEITCMLRQTAFGTLFSIAISCILGKTIIIYFAFKATQPGSVWKSFVSLKVSNCFVFCCSAVQVIINVIWLAISPPFMELDTHSHQGTIIIQCNEGSVIAFYSVLGYMGILAAVSFIIAFLARTLPDSFNEAKYITFSMLVFCSVWIAMIPAYLSTKGKYMVAVEIFAILTSSAGLLACIFFPKCFNVIFRPEINTKFHLFGNINKIGAQN